jgi:putative SOS response-associated peptidase YedK
MCNDYAREIELGRVLKAIKEMERVPPFAWQGGNTPNDIAPQAHIKISDKGFVAKLEGKDLVGDMVKWAWKTPSGKPVFNFVSEKRDFSKSERCLILATSFYEYIQPEQGKMKLKDQHCFTMRDEEWFWVAGIIKQGCFAMLTTEPGPDVKPYHDRQICLLKPQSGIDWLKLSRPESELLKPLPKGTLEHRQTRKNGVDL